MMPHLPFTFLLAALTAGASALPGARATRERAWHALYLLFTSIAAIVAGSWIMYLIHG
ncbi:MAG: hypothetical protein ABSF62_06055 [Bryobacteraceae bacterium]|jgi:cytochrome c biogenesis factor